MRNAPALLPLADCLRPGFARHRALSRTPPASSAVFCKSHRRWNGSAAWGQATITRPIDSNHENAQFPASSERDAPDGRAKHPSKNASETRHWQEVEQRLSRNLADKDGQIDREREFWRQPATANSYRWKAQTDPQRSKDPAVLQRMLEGSPTPLIYQRMRFAAGRGEVQRVLEMARYLLRGRKEQPNLKLYACLVLSHCSATDGSAHWVKNLLEELKGEGLDLDSGLCHDVLKVRCSDSFIERKLNGL